MVLKRENVKRIIAEKEQKMDPNVPLKNVPICMRAAMRYAIAKHMENVIRDDESTFTSVKSEDYKFYNRLKFETAPYRNKRFEAEIPSTEPEPDDTCETKTTVYLNPLQRTPRLIPEASRLFYRNTDDTKLYTNKYMKEMRSIYIKNIENLQKASGRLLKV